MLEDRAAQAVDGEADHVVEVGHQFVEEPLLQLGGGERLAAVLAADLGQVVAVEAQVVSGSRRSMSRCSPRRIPIGITRMPWRRGIRAAGRRSRRPPGRYAWIRSSGRFSAYCCVGGHTMPVSDFEVSRSQGGFSEKITAMKNPTPRGGISLPAQRRTGVSRTRLQTRLARASRPERLDVADAPLADLHRPLRIHQQRAAHRDQVELALVQALTPGRRCSPAAPPRRFCRRIAGTRCRPGRRYPR
ncbi:Uncharacterised protein [Pseudomonas aeruginosa]|nr:Uncharacterised protein [Pseudomonas aeruginosa]